MELIDIKTDSEIRKDLNRSLDKDSESSILRRLLEQNPYLKNSDSVVISLTKHKVRVNREYNIGELKAKIFDKMFPKLPLMIDTIDLYADIMENDKFTQDLESDKSISIKELLNNIQEFSRI